MIRIESRKRRIEASFVDELLKDAGKSLVGGLTSRLEEGSREVFQWSLRKIVGALLGASLIIAASVLLLIGGIEALREAALPSSVAHLLVGGVGLGVGLLLYKLKG